MTFSNFPVQAFSGVFETLSNIEHEAFFAKIVTGFQQFHFQKKALSLMLCKVLYTLLDILIQNVLQSRVASKINANSLLRETPVNGNCHP